MRRAAAFGPAWDGSRCVFQLMHEVGKRLLQVGGGQSLRMLNEIGYGRLCLQSHQCFLNCMVIDIGEVERSSKLALLHICNKSVFIFSARIAPAMLPYGIYFIAYLG